MDYYNMKRKELQALCKEHNIPANSANSVLADKLSELLNEKKKPVTRQRSCMKSSVEAIDESEPAVSRRQAKKVRFSPNNDLVESKLRSGKKQEAMDTEMKGRRKSVAKKVDKPLVDNDDAVELIDDGVQIPVKLTRSRVQILGKDDVVPTNEKKQGRKVIKDIEKGTDAVKKTEGNIGRVTRLKAHTLGKGGVQLDESKRSKRAVKDVEKASESVGETVVGRVRVTRSKAQTLMEDDIGSDLNPQVKKKSSRRVAKDSENPEPSKEITDIPVRATRSRGQTLKDGMIANPRTDKKRTRRDTVVADLSNKSSNIALEDNQEPPKRKSLRSRAVETADEDEGEKLGHVRRKRSEESITEVPESQRHGLRQSRRNKAKDEDSTVLNQNVSKVEMIKVTRSKTTKSSGGNSKSKDENKVQVQKKSKIVQQLEEPLEHAGRKNVNRRKSVLQPENTEVAPHLEEPVNRPARSRKDVSENETKAVASAIGSHKSRKRRGDPIIEDQTIETSVSSRTLASGAMIKANSSKKKAKLSGTKQFDSEDNAEKSNTKGTPVSKLGNFELDKIVIAAEHTPVVDESGRRFTRSAIKSKRKTVGNYLGKVDRMEPSQSAIKEQRIGDAHLSSRKVAKFKPDPAINTAPGRFTRSGIKQGGSAISKLSEKKVDKKKHSSKSAHQSQAIDDAQMTSPNPDVISSSVQKTINADTIGVRSEISEDAKGQILEHFADLSALESDRLPTELVEETRIFTSEPANVMENISSVSGEIASGVESHTISKYETGATLELTENLLNEKQQSPVGLPNFEDETLSGTNLSDTKATPFSVAEAVEPMSIALSDGSYVQKQDQEVNLNSEIFGEAEASVPKSAEKETESTESGSRSNELQIDVMVEEPMVSVGKTVVMEESVDIAIGVTSKENNGDADINRDSIPYEAVSHESFEHSNIKSTSKGMEAPLEPSITEGVAQVIADDGAQIEKGSAYKGSPHSHVGKHEVADNGERDDEDEKASAQKESMNEPVFEDKIVHGSPDMIADGVDVQEIDSYDVEPNKDDTMEQSTGDDKLHGLEDKIVHGSPDMIADGVDVQEIDSYDVEPNKDDTMQQSTGDDKLHRLEMDENDIKDDIVTGNDAPKIPILGNSDGEDESVNATKECETDLTPLTADNMLEDPVLSSADGEYEKPLTDNDVSDALFLDKDGDDVPEMPILGNSDGEDDSANATKDHETDSTSLTAGNAIADLESYLKPPTGNNVEDDGIHVVNELEPVLEPSNADNTLEAPVSGDAIGNNDVEDDGSNVLEPGLEPSDTNNTLEVPVSGNDVDSECAIDDNREREQEQLTSNDDPAIDEQDVGGDEPKPAQNEKIPELLIGFSDQEPDPIAADEDCYDTIEQSDSPSGNDDIVTRVDDLEESMININKDGVSDNLGDMDEPENTAGVTDTENDISFDEDEQKILGAAELDEGVQSKESESNFVDMSNEQRTENDPALMVDDDLDGDKLMEDCSNDGVDENTTREESSPIAYTKEEPTIDDTASDPLMVYTGANGSPITEESLPTPYKKEESPIGESVSDPSTSFKDHNRAKQEQTQNASTSVDWGNYSFGIDEFQKPVSEDLQTPARANSSLEERSTPAADLVKSVTNLENASINVADGRSNQDVNVMNRNANADVAEEFFSWSDTSLKGLFTTPAASRIGLVKDGQEGAVSFAFSDEDIGRNGAASNDFDHQWKNAPSGAFNDKTQGDATHDPGHGEDPIDKMYGVPNFENFPHKYFDDEEAGTSHHDASGLKDNSVCSGEFEKKEETQPKDSETGDNLASDKGRK